MTSKRKNTALASPSSAPAPTHGSYAAVVAAAAAANGSTPSSLSATANAVAAITNDNQGASMALHSMSRSLKRMKADDELNEEKVYNESKRAAEGAFGASDLAEALGATPDTTTTNGASSFSTTSCHRLDLFFGGLNRGTDAATVQRMVASSWNEGPWGPKHTLQILLHARDCRGGKGEKATVLAALLWLRRYKPLTYAANLQRFIDVGYYKDLLQLAYMVQSDSLSVPTLTDDTNNNDNDDTNNGNGSKKKKSHKGRTDATKAAKKAGQPTLRGGRGRRGGRGGATRGGTNSRGGLASAVHWVVGSHATPTTNDDDDNKPMTVGTDEDTPAAASSSSSSTTIGEDGVVIRRSGAALLGRHDLLEVEMFADQLQRDKRAYDEYATALAAWQATQPTPAKKESKEAAGDDTTKDKDGMDVTNDGKKGGKKQKRVVKKKDNATPAAATTDGNTNTNGNGDKDKDDDKDGTSRRPKLSLTLASKWAPTEKNSFDRRAGLAKRIAVILFPATAPSSSSKKASSDDMKAVIAGNNDGDEVDRADATARSEKNGKIRSLILYRKLLTQLRGHLRVVETLMCRGDWHRIAFEGVPSRAHHALKHAFKRHQPDRYQRYLEDVASGKKTIKSQGVQPHELVQRYYQGQPLDETVEAMWRTQIAKLRDKGRLHRCIALSDVSGSMEGQPMMVSIALGLMVSQLAPTDSPFYRRVLTFETTPRLHHIPDTAITLHDQVASLRSAPWGGSTNIEAAFRLILDTARAGNVPAEQMPRTLFIFSDMQFDAAAGNGGEGWTRTIYDSMADSYRTAGYQIPQIVFWNLRADTVDFPVYKDTPNVALVSGFSKDLLELFMDGEEGLSPQGILLQAICDYECTIIDAEK